MKADRRDFYGRHQRMTCYLQITDECRHADGKMVWGLRGHPALARHATWEHLKPRAKVGKHNVVLIACAECNSAKADASIATDEQLEFARLLRRVWLRVSGGQDEWAAFSAEGAPWITRDGERVLALPLPIDRSIAAPSRKKKRSASRPEFVPREYGVPQTVEEALAQGGVRIAGRIT